MRRLKLWATVFGLLTSVIAGFFLFSPGSTEEPAPQREAVASMPSADLHPLDKLKGLESSFIALEATVVGNSGPEVRLRSDGYVDYEVDSTSGFPTVALDGVSTRGVLSESDDYSDEIDEVLALASSGSLRLVHTDGYFERGETFVFFVGYWNPGEYSAVYAYDDERDVPAPGFTSEYSDRLLESIASFWAESGERGSRVEALIALSEGLHREAGGGDRSALVAEVLGPQTKPAAEEIPMVPEGYYPMVETDLPQESDLGAYVRVELLVIVDRDAEVELALQGRRILGWFVSNDLGYAVVEGYVERGDSLRLLRREPGSSNSEAVAHNHFGLNGNGFDVSNDIDQLMFIVDLSVDQRANLESSFERHDSFDSFHDRLEELQPILDASVRGSELEEGPGMDSGE